MTPLPGGQKVLFALGTGIFAYQILTELVHRVAQEHFENQDVNPTYVVGVLTMCCIGVIASCTSPLLIYFCFATTGIMAFILYRSPISLGSPPPSGLLDMVAAAEFHPEWGYCLPDETLLPLLETALKHPDKQNIILLGDTKIGKTLQIEYLAWMLKHKKLPKNSPLEKLRLFAWGNDDPTDVAITSILKFFKDHPNAFFFIDRIPHNLLTFGKIQSAMQRGELRLIGTATSDEYREKFASDNTLNGLWHQLPMNEPSKEQCVKILEMKIPLLLKKYGGLSVSKEALDVAILLSKMIWPKLKQPASAYDLLNRICPYVVTGMSPSSSGLVIGAKEIIQGAKEARLIENDFDLSQLNPPKQDLSSSATQELLPVGLIDMIAQAESHPEWAYGANIDDLIPKIVTAQAESWRKSILLQGHQTNINLLIQNLAWRIKNKTLPSLALLEHIRIVRLNPNQLLNDGSYGSAKGEVVKKIIEYLVSRPNTICVIENANFLLEEPSLLSNNDRKAILAITEALSEGKLRLIGTIPGLDFKNKDTQNKELQIILSFESKNPQMEQYWMIHEVPELESHQCIKLLIQAKENIERRYSGIKIAEEVAKASVILAKAYKPQNKSLWESAYDLLCQGCTQKLLSKNTDSTLATQDLAIVVINQKMTKDPYRKLLEIVEKKLMADDLNISDNEDYVL